MTNIFEKLDDFVFEHYDTSRFCRILVNIFTFPDYLKYLFAKADNPRWSSDNLIIDWFIRLKCRIKHHPCGSIYYNPGGYEPDGRCKDCGDLIA